MILRKNSTAVEKENGHNAHIVNIQIDGLAACHVGRIAQEEDLVKIAGQAAAYGKNEQQRNGRTDTLDGDIPHLAPAPGPVQFSRFVQPRVNTRDRSQINNGAPSHFFQCIGEERDPPELLWVAVIQDWFVLQAQGHHKLINNSGLGQPGKQDTAENCPGDEMRHIRQRLNQSLKLGILDLIEHKRKENRNTKSQRDP